MKPYERLAEAKAPDGSILSLFRHDGAYIMRVNGVDLMSTRVSQSEVQLAELTCGEIRARPAARVLIGGLGFGFTLKAALRMLEPDASVVVAELVGEVIAWNQNREFALAHEALGDSRVDLQHADVWSVLRDNKRAFDAIMLDVDNGAESLTTRGNSTLYSLHGVYTAVESLRRGGYLGYWSSTPEPKFVNTLKHAGLDVEVHSVRARPTGGAYHTIIVARQK